MENAVTGELFARQILIASIDDLLTMKRVANRPKGQLDIVALEKIKRGEDPMPETGMRVRQTISEETMLNRLAQSEQVREFFIQMWSQNPVLAKQAGAKVRNLMTQLDRGDVKEKPRFFSDVGSTRWFTPVGGESPEVSKSEP